MDRSSPPATRYDAVHEGVSTYGKLVIVGWSDIGGRVVLKATENFGKEAPKEVEACVARPHGEGVRQRRRGCRGARRSAPRGWPAGDHAAARPGDVGLRVKVWGRGARRGGPSDDEQWAVPFGMRNLE